MQLVAFGLVPDESRAAHTLDMLESSRNAWSHSHGDDPLTNDQLHELLRDVVADTVRQASAPLLLGLTAGFDSRPLLHALRELGVEPQLYCYAQPGHIDHDVVAWLNERHDLGVEVFDTRRTTFTLKWYDEHAQTQNPSPLGPGQQAWRWAHRRFGRSTLMHGYLNDALTGDNRAKFRGAGALDARESFMAVNNQFALQSEFDRRLLDFLCPGDSVSRDRHLDLYTQYDHAYRQASRIKPQPGAPHDFAFAYTDARWVGYWLTRPMSERAGQRRWYEFVKSLKSPLFDDIAGLEHFEGRDLRFARKRRFYGHNGQPGILDFSQLTSARQNEPAHPFDFVAVYRANASFRDTVSESLRRLRGRGLVYGSVVDAVERRFARGDHAAGLVVNSFMTIDVHVEAGVV